MPISFILTSVNQYKNISTFYTIFNQSPVSRPGSVNILRGQSNLQIIQKLNKNAADFDHGFAWFLYDFFSFWECPDHWAMAASVSILRGQAIITKKKKWYKNWVKPRLKIICIFVLFLRLPWPPRSTWHWLVADCLSHIWAWKVFSRKNVSLWALWGYVQSEVQCSCLTTSNHPQNSASHLLLLLCYCAVTDNS